MSWRITFLKKTQRPQFLWEQGSFFGIILSIFSLLIIHEFQKLKYSSTFCTSLLTDTKKHEKKRKNQKFFYFPGTTLKGFWNQKLIISVKINLIPRVFCGLWKKKPQKALGTRLSKDSSRWEKNSVCNSF